jgi:tRNA A-37 threonylcarbamoyl transferase component Bud32
MEPDQTDTAARTVGRYEILRQIGQGGMATVYLARQSGLDREVALKELDRFGAADQKVFTSRFVREAKLAGSLGHPNIVTVLDYFEHEGRPYIAMEHLEGGSLREYLGDLSTTQVMGVLEGLLAGLIHAESRGIAHRDIKPENILVTAEGQVKLTDFGIARAYDAALGGSLLTVAGTTVGTPRYMAPEQATGQQLSAATDLYAVGVVAYEMLVGQVPFDSDESALAIVWQHVNDPVPDPRVARPDLDPRLCRWLEELLAKDPADRPASAHAALDALEEIVLDMLGGRWRRDARLAAPRVAPEGARPLTPARVEQVADELTGVGSSAAQGDGHAETIVPRALRDLTAPLRSLGRERRARAAAPPTPVGGRWRTPALVAGATLVAAIVGYALFAGAPPAERAPAARSPATLADDAARQRFVVDMTTVLQRLAAARADTLKRLGEATTAPGQAKVARQVAAAYGAAATASSALAPAASQRAPATRVRRQLRRAGRAYADLAAAAKAHAASRYDAASRAIAADEAQLNRLVARVPS